ncbi:Glutathione [Seminavis robusta]|uniref:Glutathione n=1 Tax=Seminavis robusta TaxID=568900 RepID=A0A9N8ELR2_9STRA|nr:Glutathione [Seminavis robusta]|eukprot:Sro1295_g260280.1 Glutathione (179) ;mRNA; f:19388-19924
MDDDTILCESLVVSEYVVEEFGGSLIPSSPKDRATMRLFTELCGSNFAYFSLLRAKEDKLEAALKTFQEGLVATNAFLKHHSSGGPFLLGEQFTLAEVSVAPFVQRACIILPAFTSNTNVVVNPRQICDELGLDHLKAWIEAVMARPSVIATGVPEEDLVKGTKRMLERFAEMEKKFD